MINVVFPLWSERTRTRNIGHFNVLSIDGKFLLIDSHAMDSIDLNIKGQFGQDLSLMGIRRPNQNVLRSFIELFDKFAS